MKKKVLIMGAAGRDFHNFNTVFRGNKNFEVVCFTATQIPNIDDRKYPAQLAGKGYPRGIPIYSEEDLTAVIRKKKIDWVAFSYSDIPHTYVMHKASQVMAQGASFILLGPKETQLQSKVPVVAVCAVRTGSGKSQTTRRVADVLKKAGRKLVVVRHPMPYGNLVKQTCQRFASFKDLDRYDCTIEEREEYEPHLERKTVVYAGVDYEKILRQAEKEAEIILWDGGNNDYPFFKPDLLITIVDPHRPGHELGYFPGEQNLWSADVVVINKVDTAAFENVQTVRKNVERINPRATIIEAASPIFVEGGEMIRDKKVLVVEDGPTLTHGEMEYGAGVVAARKFGAKELIDPRPFIKGSLVEVYKKYPHIGRLLPAMGYGAAQIRDMQQTINRVPADLVIVATPIDLGKLLTVKKPLLRVRYELEELGKPGLKDVLAPFLKRKK
ncbi:MAG: cyclic 2,3-diphosphoglycerate synthase [candidate division Zixibacteria bacterium]|nr:cyclic 2,3-diphosphoglycerate synthase [candidate division Zixibacteria bacterium]